MRTYRHVRTSLTCTNTYAHLGTAVGAICDGSTLRGVINGSMWLVNGDKMRLQQCPAGYVLIRDEYQPILDQ
jgi:hypothetical protein